VRHAWVLATAAGLIFLVAQPAGATAPDALAVRHLEAVQIDAVIEQPATVPIPIARPAHTATVHPGQTVESLASAFGSDASAVRWANGLGATAQPAAGTPLLLPPTAGALVQVHGGETPTQFAARVRLDPATVLDYNALTSDAPLPAGSFLQVPLPDAPRGSLIASRFADAGGGVPEVPPSAMNRTGASTFPWGQCTWYVATKRNVTWAGNAWVWYAAAAGIRPEGRVPVEGAIAVFDIGWAGHVAYVEHVNPDGSFVVSEMNYYTGYGGGWGVVDRRTIAANDPTITGFIY
jgi:surface antigen